MATTIKMSDLKDCYFDPASGRVIDAVHPETGLGVYGGQTLVECQEEYPEAYECSLDDAVELAEARFITKPQEITEEQWNEALNMLPPVGYNGQTFRMGERLSGRITGIYARVGSRYYAFADSIHLTHAEIMARVQEAFPKAASSS